MPPDRTLYQFAFSHYNEKARWGLDWKGLAHRRVYLLPGPHARRVARLSGQTQTPVLVSGDRVIAGSTAILEAIEGEAPARPLFPADPRERVDVDRSIEWLDETVGPAVRLALFEEMLATPRYAARVFTAGQPAWKRAAYTTLMPVLVPKLRAAMSIDRENARLAGITIEKALDRIATATAATGHLVGSRFTAADLTAAALLFPLCFPAELPVALPRPAPERIEAWLARWADHPGVAWTRRIFANHRRPPSAPR